VFQKHGSVSLHECKVVEAPMQLGPLEFAVNLRAKEKAQNTSTSNPVIHSELCRWESV
jgi:hypothetical protein